MYHRVIMPYFRIFVVGCSEFLTKTCRKVAKVFWLFFYHVWTSIEPLLKILFDTRVRRFLNFVWETFFNLDWESFLRTFLVWEPFWSFLRKHFLNPDWVPFINLAWERFLSLICENFFWTSTEYLFCVSSENLLWIFEWEPFLNLEW